MDTETVGSQTRGPDLGGLYSRSVQWWSRQVSAVANDQWDLPTPCSDWSVRRDRSHLFILAGFIALYRIFQDYVLNPTLMRRRFGAAAAGPLRPIGG